MFNFSYTLSPATVKRWNVKATDAEIEIEALSRPT